MLEVGSVLDGKYKILNKVGQGGMSVVYLAMNERANKQWAVKEVRKDGVLDFESVKQGLVAETDILKKLSHPHLPSIIDVIDTEDSFIIIMDYVQGNSLDKALKQFGAQPQESVIEWAKQLCDVLGYLHTRQPAIIYRDMKPANVMLKPDGSISLIDFGTAREHKAFKVEDTTCLGTRGYAAPEQYGGMGQTDARTDIYCLGATIYHLVTGYNPSEPPYEMLPIRQIDPSLSAGLEKIILKCTQSNPDDRYQSCAELMYALEHYDEIDDEFRRKQKNKLRLFIAYAALTLVFAGVALWANVAADDAKRANYDFQLANAHSADDYYETILTDPTRTEAYLGNGDYKGFVEFLVDDDDGLSRKDKSLLEKLKIGLESEGSGGYNDTVKVLTELKKADPKGYKKVCYEIGEAHLFYYDAEDKDKYAAAATWFKECTGAYPVAKIYCDVSECLKNLEKYDSSNQTGKMFEEYKTLWSNMKALLEQSNDMDDDLKIRVWNVVTNTIDYNITGFCAVEDPGTIKTVLNGVSDSADDLTNSFLKGEIELLKTKISGTIVRIDTIKNS